MRLLLATATALLTRSPRPRPPLPRGSRRRPRRRRRTSRRSAPSPLRPTATAAALGAATRRRHLRRSSSRAARQAAASRRRSTAAGDDRPGDSSRARRPGHRDRRLPPGRPARGPGCACRGQVSAAAPETLDIPTRASRIGGRQQRPCRRRVHQGHRGRARRARARCAPRRRDGEFGPAAQTIAFSADTGRHPRRRRRLLRSTQRQRGGGRRTRNDGARDVSRPNHSGSPTATLQRHGASISDRRRAPTADSGSVVVDAERPDHRALARRDARADRRSRSVRAPAGEQLDVARLRLPGEQRHRRDTGGRGDAGRRRHRRLGLSSAGAIIVQAAVRAAGGGNFVDLASSPGPGMDVQRPVVSVGRGGDTLFVWTTSMGEAIFAVHRLAGRRRTAPRCRP